MKKRILIVDDDKSILHSMSGVLQRSGYAVDTSETAKDAVDKVKSKRFDLVIVDIWLPEVKGTDFLAKMKQELEQTVKFIITGYPSAEAGANARDLGADAFILKPVKMTELLSVIRLFLFGEEYHPYLADEKERRIALSEVNSEGTSKP